MSVWVPNMLVYTDMKTRKMAESLINLNFNLRWSRESSAAGRCWYNRPNDTNSSDCRWCCWWVSDDQIHVKTFKQRLGHTHTFLHCLFLITAQQCFSRFHSEEYLINILKCSSCQNDASLPLFPISCCQQRRADKHRYAEVNLKLCWFFLWTERGPSTWQRTWLFFKLVPDSL